MARMKPAMGLVLAMMLVGVLLFAGCGTRAGAEQAGAEQAMPKTTAETLATSAIVTPTVAAGEQGELSVATPEKAPEAQVEPVAATPERVAEPEATAVAESASSIATPPTVVAPDGAGGPTGSDDMVIKPRDVPLDETLDWQVYADKTYRVQVKYPQDWVAVAFDVQNTPDGERLAAAVGFRPRAWEDRVALTLEICEGDEEVCQGQWLLPESEKAVIHYHEATIYKSNGQINYVFKLPNRDVHVALVSFADVVQVDGIDRDELSSTVKSIVWSISFPG